MCISGGTMLWGEWSWLRPTQLICPGTANGSAPFRALSCSPDTRRPLLLRPAPSAALAAPSPAAAVDALAPSPLSAVHRAARAAPRPSRTSPRGLTSPQPTAPSPAAPAASSPYPGRSATGHLSAHPRAARPRCQWLPAPSIAGWAGRGPWLSGACSSLAPRLRKAPAPRRTRRGPQPRLRSEFPAFSLVAEVAGPLQFRLGVVRFGQNGEDRQDPRR